MVESYLLSNELSQKSVMVMEGGGVVTLSERAADPSSSFN